MTKDEKIAATLERFEKWWRAEGRFLDPDHADVPWFDKRKALCEYAFAAGATPSPSPDAPLGNCFECGTPLVKTIICPKCADGIWGLIIPVRDAEPMTSEPKAKADSEAEQGVQLSRPEPASPDAARLADELNALVEKATPAPWIADDFCMERDRAVRIGTTDGRDDYYLRSATVCECWTNHDDEEPIDQRGPRIGVIDAERNAKLIAWLRNNSPAIVKALREVGK